MEDFFNIQMKTDIAVYVCIFENFNPILFLSYSSSLLKPHYIENLRTETLLQIYGLFIEFTKNCDN